MITNPHLVKALLGLLALLSGTLAILKLAPPLRRVWRRATALGRTLFMLFAGVLALHGGSKPSRPLACPRPRLAAPAPSPTPAPSTAPSTAPDDPRFRPPRGYELVAVSNETDFVYAPPSDAATFAPWTVHGAREAWCRAGGRIAFTGGYLRSTPRDETSEAGYHGDDFLVAVPGVSQLWWTEAADALTVTWQDFASAPAVTPDATNTPVSVQLLLTPTNCVIRANDEARYYSGPYDPQRDESLVLALDAPAYAVRNGLRKPVAVTCSSLAEMKGSLTLACTDGADRVRLFADAEATEPLALPVTLPLARSVAETFYLEAVGTSATPDDVQLSLALRGPGGAEAVRTQRMTAVEVVELAMSSPDAGNSPHPPPFPAGGPDDFDPALASHQERHLVIPYANVVTNLATGAVRDFAVAAELHVLPTDWHGAAAAWCMDSSSPTSGTLLAGADGLSAEFANPKRGGVYLVDATLDGVRTTGAVVLPCAGAEVVQVLERDLYLADVFASLHRTACQNAMILERIWLGLYWFGTNDTGYYRGRPDSLRCPTVWYYNQVNDDSGLGAVGTLCGCPVRIEKLANLLCGFTCEKLGVSPTEQWLAQYLGTPNGESANLSWAVGVALAHDADHEPTLGAFVRAAWAADREGNARFSALWPNPEPTDNHRTTAGHGDFNHEFSSPGFIYLD